MQQSNEYDDGYSANSARGGPQAGYTQGGPQSGYAQEGANTQQPPGPGQGYATAPPQHPDRAGAGYAQDQYSGNSDMNSAAGTGTGAAQAPGGGTGYGAAQTTPVNTTTGGGNGVSGALNSIPGSGAAKMFGGRMQHVAGQLMSDEGMKAQGIEREARGRELRDAQEAQEIAQAEAKHQERMGRRNVV